MYKNVADQLACRRRHYGRNKAAYIKQAADNKKAIRAFVLDLKLARGCAACGYRKCGAALAFHHESGEKELSIARAVTQGWGKKRLLAEIDKCVVLCSNCHLERHHCEG